MLSDLQIRKVTRLFSVWDADNDGFITSEDPREVGGNLAQLRGLKPGSDDYQAFQQGFMIYWNDMMGAVDTSGDGRVSLEEWIKYHELLLADPGRLEQTAVMTASVMFNLMDVDGDGQITLEEYGNWMRAFRMGDESVNDAVFARLDVNGDGTLSQDEVLELTRQFYMSDDPNARGNWALGPY